jgi:putative ABC transport system permease protein
MRALDRKLLRDLRHGWGQGLAIALVVAGGVAMYVAYVSTFRSLRATQEAFYERYRFADVFASLKRAPADVVDRARAIPGVANADGRVTMDVTLDVPGLVEPAIGRLVSTPVPRRSTLNDTYLRSGRDLSGAEDEVLVSEGFARAHGLAPGATVAAVINGRRRELRIAGIALSPEYVYAVRAGEIMPDETRFGVFWMDHRALAAAFDMTGGVNQVGVTLLPGASESDVIHRLDRLLEPYGGLGAVGRQHQTSHFYIDSEMRQLQSMGLVVPSVFFAVAAFLLNVALMRIVAIQREQVAALKALGYSHLQLGVHYAGWALAIAGAGAAIGVSGGAWMGAGMMEMYNEYFRFPELDYRLNADVAATGVLVALGAALAGASVAVRRAVALPPAEAMRPEAPAGFRVTPLERLGLKRWLSPVHRMILRNIVRQPVRALTTIFGIAVASGLLIVGMFSLDAIGVLIDLQFFTVQRQDATVSFVERAPRRALFDTARLPGVMAAEPFLTVAVRLRSEHRSRLTGVTGIVAEPRLARLVDADAGLRPVPPDGIVLSSMLAGILGAGIRDVITVELLEGRRESHRVPVAAIVQEYMGTAAYMEIDALRRLAGAGDVVSGAFLDIDPARSTELYAALKRAPRVASVGIKRAALDNFSRTLDETLFVLVFFNVLFAGTIAFGVVYNAARVSLSERARELASLRILGFTRREISGILLGELGVLTAAAIPAGFVFGYAVAAAVAELVHTEMFRLPVVVASRTYAYAALVTLAAAAVSAFVVRRRLDHLDLVAVLKARE